MKKIIYLFTIMSVLFISCTDDFEDMNKSKTGSTSISPDPVFTRSLVTGSGISYQVWQLMHQTTTSAWVQHWANIQPTFTGDRYEPSLGTTVWNFYYSRQHFAPLMLNYRTMELIKETDNNPIKMACAKIWNVYMFHHITDSYGDIPYSDAFKSERPKFDPQKSVYEDMLKTLAESVGTIKAERNNGYPTFGSADVLYQGDLDKWIKFANSLTIRLSLRVSNVDPALGESYVKNINPSEVILLNTESAMIKTMKGTEAPTHEVKNAMGFVYSWQEVRMSKTFMDYLDGTKYGGVVDPRLKQFAEVTKANSDYKGLENGQPNQSLASDPDSYKNNYSNIGPYFNTQAYEVPILLLTSAESNFLMAEAKLKGWLNGGNSVQQYYEAGIKASMEHFRKFWDGTEAISTTEETDYLAAPGVAFNSAKAAEQIATQKWIALYTNDQEAWSEMRRTGYPEIAPLVDPFPGNTEMPRRRMYSQSEITYNNENYNSAVTRMGGDTQYTRVWWDGGK